jgi:hypothetical protein
VFLGKPAACRRRGGGREGPGGLCAPMGGGITAVDELWPPDHARGHPWQPQLQWPRSMVVKRGYGGAHEDKERAAELVVVLARLETACGYKATAAGDVDGSALGGSDLRRSSWPRNGHRRWAMRW